MGGDADSAPLVSARVESSGMRRTARRFAVTRRANGLVRERDGARHGESLTLEPRGGPMGSGFFSSGAFSAGAASSCGGREGDAAVSGLGDAHVR